MWDDDDQDKALAYLRHSRDICSGCGTRLEEWSGEDGKIDPRKEPYTAVAERCPGCERLEKKRQHIAENAEHMGKGLRVRLVRNGG